MNSLEPERRVEVHCKYTANNPILAVLLSNAESHSGYLSKFGRVSSRTSYYNVKVYIRLRIQVDLSPSIGMGVVEKFRSTARVAYHSVVYSLIAVCETTVL